MFFWLWVGIFSARVRFRIKKLWHMPGPQIVTVEKNMAQACLLHWWDWVGSGLFRAVGSGDPCMLRYSTGSGSIDESYYFIETPPRL